jgi:hypothetical protein
MPLPTFMRLTDYITQIIAVHFNQYADALDKIAPSVPHANYSETTTLTGNRTLTDADLPLLYFDPGAASRDVTLPAEASTNHPIWLKNTDDTYNLIVKNDGGTIIDIVYPGDALSFVSNGTDWRVAGGKKEQTDYINGLKITWVSTTAIDIETGAAFVPSLGRVLRVGTKISKTGLSLSASTWYHVYLYESSGAPAVEVVTTAPATAYFGTARAKTADTSRRYLGSILTDGSSNVYKFSHDVQRGLVHWLDTNQTASPFRVLSAGTATSATSVAMGGCCPATAVTAVVEVTNTSDQNVRFGNSSSISSTAYSVRLNPGNVVIVFITAEIPINASANIYYRIDSAVGVGGASIDCYGYVYER